MKRAAALTVFVIAGAVHGQAAPDSQLSSPLPLDDDPIISAGLLLPSSVTVDPIPASNGPSAVRIVLRNDTPGTWPKARPVVLRRVFWAGQEAGAEHWLRPLPGITVNLEDGRFEYQSARTIAHTADSVPMTEEAFETGLLSAGRTLIVGLPRPRKAGSAELVIRYAVVPRGTHILLPEHPGRDRTVYSLPEPTRLRAYQPGTPVLIFPQPLEVRETRLTIALPPEQGSNRNRRHP